MRPRDRQAHDDPMSKRGGPEPTWDEELIQLIQLGRDREAAELASHRLAPLTTEAPMDPRTQLDDIVPRLNLLSPACERPVPPD